MIGSVKDAIEHKKVINSLKIVTVWQYDWNNSTVLTPQNL